MLDGRRTVLGGGRDLRGCEYFLLEILDSERLEVDLKGKYTLGMTKADGSHDENECKRSEQTANECPARADAQSMTSSRTVK